MSSKINPHSRLDRKLNIVKYNKNWPVNFQAEKVRILANVNTRCVIEHVGSTSIVDMISKPTIDIMVGLLDMSKAESVIDDLVSLGYLYIYEMRTRFPHRHFLYLGSENDHQFHIHIVKLDGLDWKELILFRDYLRINSDARTNYKFAKLEGLKKSGHSISAYADGKRKVYLQLLKKSKEER